MKLGRIVGSHRYPELERAQGSHMKLGQTEVSHRCLELVQAQETHMKLEQTGVNHMYLEQVLAQESCMMAGKELAGRKRLGLTLESHRSLGQELVQALVSHMKQEQTEESHNCLEQELAQGTHMN